MGQAVLDFLGDPDRGRSVQSVYREIQGLLRRNAGRQAADAILALVQGDGLGQ